MKKKYTYFTSLEAYITPSANAVEVVYDAPRGFGTLSNCDFSRLNLSDALGSVLVLDEGRTLCFAISACSELRIEIAKIFDDGDVHGSASFVISMDKEAFTDEEYICPVCGDKGPFTAFPPTEFTMATDGSMTIPEGMAPDPSFDDDIEVRCPACSFEGKKADFFSEFWDEAGDSEA